MIEYLYSMMNECSMFIKMTYLQMYLCQYKQVRILINKQKRVPKKKKKKRKIAETEQNVKNIWFKRKI